MAKNTSIALGEKTQTPQSQFRTRPSPAAARVSGRGR
jgi:hypothetical protein